MLEQVKGFWSQTSSDPTATAQAQGLSHPPLVSLSSRAGRGAGGGEEEGSIDSCRQKSLDSEGFLPGIFQDRDTLQTAPSGRKSRESSWFRAREVPVTGKIRALREASRGDSLGGKEFRSL